jgi:hypothetical protein
MRKFLKGKIRNNGRYFVAELPMIKLACQGRNSYQSLMSLKQLIEMLANDPQFISRVFIEDNGNFFIGSNDSVKFEAFIQRRTSLNCELDSIMVPLKSIA